MIWIAEVNKKAFNFSCPSEITWKNHPRGLSVIKRQRFPMNDFRYLINPKKTYPFKLVEGPIIRSEYDGVGVKFYCHQGNWLFRQFH